MVKIDKDTIYAELLKITKENNIKADEPMTKHTSFKIGGIADWFITLDNIEEIKKILFFVKEYNIPLYIIGNGTNLLIKDKGVRGIVLKVNLDFINVKEKEDYIEVTVGAGTKLVPFARKMAKKGISGFEFASGIPGTIGGAIRMNAGAYGKEMKDVVISTKYIDYNGTINEISNEKHNFLYRSSIFKNKIGIILETTLKLKKGNVDDIEKLIEEYKEKRVKSQPIGIPNAGSTFKRGDDYITAKLIDDAGLKGFKIGDAEVSTIHAGFIVNNGNATAKQVLELIEYIKKEVYNKFKKKIILEIEIIGE